MKKILHIMRSLEAGGIGTFILNIYQKIDKTKFQFDIAVTHGGKGLYGNEIENDGGHIYFLSQYGNRNIFDGVIQLKNLFLICKKQKYDIVHCHYYFANAYFLAIAKMCGIKKRVSHCHNAFTEHESVVTTLFHFMSRRLLFLTGTDFLACSESAAKYLYGNTCVENRSAYVLYNGIDYSRWDASKFDTDCIRSKYAIGREKKIISYIGRFEKQKNPMMALEIIQKIHESYNNIVFFMVGYGSYLSQIHNYIEKYNMYYVKVLPSNTSVLEIQAISDIMLAPSLWEGLSIAFIEAQVMKTIVVTSTNVSNEIDMGYCEFEDLNDVDKWVQKMINILKSKEVHKREFNENYLLFDVDITTKNLMKIYRMD